MAEPSSCGHDHGGPAPGPVYRLEYVDFQLGVVFRSTPLTYEEGYRMLEDRGNTGGNAGLYLVPPEEAKRLLLEDADELVKDADRISLNVAPMHQGFNQTADVLRALAEKLRDRANAL